MNNKLKICFLFSAFASPFIIVDEAQAMLKKGFSSGSRTYSAYRTIREDMKKLTPVAPKTTDVEYFETSIKGKPSRLAIKQGICDEGFKKLYVEHDGEEHSLMVTPSGKKMLTLSMDELKYFSDTNFGSVLLARDTLGRDRFVVVIDGDNDPIAVTLDTGVWRHAQKKSGTEIYLGHEVDYNKLSVGTKNRVEESSKAIFNFSEGRFD